MKDNKLILFLDVDGVLFGDYDGTIQLRPGVTSFLIWAVEHFDVRMLTGWPEKEIFELLRLVYTPPNVRGKISYSDWTNNKSEAFMSLGDDEMFYWVEDDLFDRDKAFLENRGWLRRFIRILMDGESELNRVRRILVRKLNTK